MPLEDQSQFPHDQPVYRKVAIIADKKSSTMDSLPDEVILHILWFLEIPDIVHLQSVAPRYLALGRDDALWKTACFDHSRAESLRRRQRLLRLQDTGLSRLRNAFSALPGEPGRDPATLDVLQSPTSPQPQPPSDPAVEARRQRSRALTNWEPGYPGEQLNYYEEYIHRHAPIDIGWLKLPKDNDFHKDIWFEATGLGLLENSQSGTSPKLVAPLDDGSICIWDISARSLGATGGGGRLVGRSRRGLLTGQAEDATAENHIIMTETGSVESVAIDSHSSRGYFAVQNHLHEVDLATLQLVSTKLYPFSITALSEANGRTPVTVGTNMTIHLYDPRDPTFAPEQAASGGELIGGSVYSHATLAEPGPLSILHHDGFERNESSIWVAGRFTSLLNYDRRFFPRLRGTIFSGARIASLSLLPHPLVPRHLDLVRNPNATISALQEARSNPGMTVLAAAEYKGKGSLELYGLPQDATYQNRQTASSTKLLSAAPHGGQIVSSDGDGNLKWMERDGFSFIRTFNINDKPPGGVVQDASAYGIWSSTASEMPGQGDIVQKILPLKPGDAHGDGRMDINQSNLLLWTGDGALGMLGFGHRDPLGEREDWHDAVEAQVETIEQRAKEDAERQYGMAMRRALERNADEVRFVRGLGILR